MTIRAFAGTPASFRYRAATLMERRIELAGEGERMPLGARITEVEIILPGWPATERDPVPPHSLRERAFAGRQRKLTAVNFFAAGLASFIFPLARRVKISLTKNPLL